LRNLRSLRQRCHLLHDQPYHRAQRWITFRRRYATGDLFLGFYVPSHIDSDAAETAQGVDAVASPLSLMRAFAPRRAEAGGYATKLRIIGKNSGRSSSCPFTELVRLV
jgi:hypothetical protein